MWVRGPCFAAVQQHQDTDSLVDSHLGWDRKSTTEEDLMLQSATGGRSSLNTMLNFTDLSAIITQYAPQIPKLACLNNQVAMYRKRRCGIIVICSKGQDFHLLSVDRESNTSVSR